MSRPVDQSTRERALDLSRSFIVQAPAGSGKTELLIRRFLTLLGVVGEPEEVVAITFTKKAAAEMRERVIRAMTDAQEPKLAAQYDQALWSIAREAWANNRKHNWQLERYPSRLRIQTIDALSAALTRQMPWLSGFGASLQVVEDASELYRTAALETLQLLVAGQKDWRDAVAVLLVHLDNQVDRAVELLTEMLRYRDQWLRHLGRHMAKDEQQKRAVLEKAWSQTIRQELDSALHYVPVQLKDKIVECAVYAAAQLKKTNSNSTVTAWDQAQSFVETSPDDLPRWRGLRELLLTVKGDWRRQVNVKNGFPASGLRSAVTMKRVMNELLAQLVGDDGFKEALNRVGRIPNASFDDRQWEVLSALTCLLPLAAARLNLLFGERGQVDFTEINMRANQALGSLDSPSDLALRLDCQINHLLVDEFQDTSLTQYELIQHLTAGWVAGDGRTLFLVGDPMQSIYRFREAEVGLFLRVQTHGIGSLKPIPLLLSANFRSDSKVVDWVNATFSSCFPPLPDLARGAVGFTTSHAFATSLQYAGVKFHPFCDVDENVEAQHVVELIQQTWKHNPTDNIAILVRARSTLREILPALDDAGIAYSGVDIKALDWQPGVRDLLSLTCALLFPADRVAWLSILRAPWCGLTLSDLHLLANGPGSVCIWERVQDGANIAQLSEDGQQRLKPFVGTISRALSERGRLPLHRWIENVWIELGGPACIDDHEFDDVQIYLDLLRDYHRRVGVEDRVGFAKAVGECWARAESGQEQRLQVMTLHKAKGLEFDTVIIPGIHRQLRTDDPRLLLWEEQMDRDDASLLLAPLAEVGPNHDYHYDYLRTIHAEKDHFETLRLLYVGCTRARRALHLIGSLSTTSNGELARPRSHSFLAKLWTQLGEEFQGARVGQLELFKSGYTKDLVLPLRRLPAAWRPPNYPDSVPRLDSATELESLQEEIEFSWAGETARHIGVIVHDMLERVAQDGMGSWDEQRLASLRPIWQLELGRLGVADEQASDASSRIYEALCNVFQDERARWILADGHRDAKNEYAVSFMQSGVVKNFRIDRTFIDWDDTRWIIDFKSSDHRGGQLDEFLDREQQRYRGQLEGYAEALWALEQKPIKLGLYFPLLMGWREWAYVNKESR
ncbi:MAG: UvrD-helicase domain-containing protein [Arenicellales bacterium]|nr:UvrD-helicase domain-containing protein [Arenicellales bacterium]